jgi:hypothetical protein
MLRRMLLINLLLFLALDPSLAHGHQNPRMEVLINGNPVQEYHHGGDVYIEAAKGREYVIRLSNPLNTRVAVALAVDGLNTIDARSTDAFSAKKWVLQPYQTIVIEGWQVNQRQARKFFFTTEEKSYGQWLGKTQNLGVISAVFFREKSRWAEHSGSANRPAPLGERSEHQSVDRDSGPATPKSSSQEPPAGGSAARSQKKDDYAATGIGNKMIHEVHWVSMDLDPTPVATLNVRYEFRPILVQLGILPSEITGDPLVRRAQARGFKDALFCPEPR